MTDNISKLNLSLTKKMYSRTSEATLGHNILAMIFTIGTTRSQSAIPDVESVILY